MSQGQSETKSTCPYCGVGCGVVIQSEGERITGVRGDPDHPANFGRLCSKGATLHLTASHAIEMHARLLQPMRRLQRGAAPQVLGWDAALDFCAEGFAKTIQEHGPNAVGFYVSGQLLTEDYYVFNKLTKGLIGTNNIDTNSRLCMSSAVAGYKQTLGADAPPCNYEDADHADCIFFAGSNAAWAHPVFFRRIEAAKKARPGMKVAVVDPRRTDTCELADLHLAIQPGTDVALFNGMLHIMLWEGWTNTAYVAAHTEGFEALKTLVREYTPELVAQTCGIKKEDLLLAARWFAQSTATLSLYCQGLNQSTSGTAKNAALINLHLATGQIGRAGAGPFSLTGQPNAMGGREVGGLANLLSAHRDLANPAHRAEVAALWGVNEVPSTPGKTAVEMFQAAADGEIKALWISCTNPAQSMADLATVQRALERCELVVVQEAFATTATCAYADVLLPATTWGEKTGTVTNSERRISRVRPAVAAPGEARHDWRAAADFARRLQKRLRKAEPSFGYATDEAIWNEHRETTRGRDLDITGLTYAKLDTDGPQQWPYPEGAASGKARLYEDGVFPTASGKAQFVATPYRPVAEPREARYPFSLTTGRLRDQWHGMSRTGTLGRLFGHVQEPSVQMNPQDMTRRMLKAGDFVHVTSRRGSIVLPVEPSPDVGLSQCFVAMHWGPEFVSGRSSTGAAALGVNQLTSSAFCASSKQPELKHTAVKLLKAQLPWQLLALAWLTEAEVLQARRALQSLLPQFDYAACVPFANALALGASGAQRHGVLFRAASFEAPENIQDDARLAAVEEALGLVGPLTMRLFDKKSAQRRSAKLVGNAQSAQLEGFMLAGDVSAQTWIQELLRRELPAQAYGRMLLVPGATPPVALAASGAQVCTCLNVTEPQIVAFLKTVGGTPDTRLGSLQTALRCGTNCGSCLPQLKKLVREVAAPFFHA